jgi:hypothetical protein
MWEIAMQDALLCYYIVANMLHAGYHGDAVKLLLRTLMLCRALFAGTGSTKAPPRSLAGAPVLFREMDEWVQRLTRMESYVESMA